MSDYTKQIQTIATELADQLEVHGHITVSLVEGHYQVHFDIEETGLLIGYHGENLDSLRQVLTQLVFKQVGEWVKLAVNVGDYQEEREEQLRHMADQMVDRALETQSSQSFPYLNARERRFVHLYIESVDGVKSESVGEDDERRLVVFPA